MQALFRNQAIERRVGVWRKSHGCWRSGVCDASLGYFVVSVFVSARVSRDYLLHLSDQRPTSLGRVGGIAHRNACRFLYGISLGGCTASLFRRRHKKLTGMQSRVSTPIVVVTGGTGFLGFSLVPELLSAGYEVRLLCRPRTGEPLHPKWAELPVGVHAHEVDFSEVDALARACAGATAVVHAAGVVSYDRKDQERMKEVHVDLTSRMLDAAQWAQVKRFVHVSSIVTLGCSRELRDETSVFNAETLRLAYWDTKAAAERLALAANDPPRFEVVVVNPGSLLGPGEKYGQLSSFLMKLARSKRPFLPDGGSDFLDVRDAAQGTVAALKCGRAGERYVLGGFNLTYAQLHARLRAALGLASHPRILPRWSLASVEKFLCAFEACTGVDLPVNSARLRRVNGVYMFHDLSKARCALGFQPRPIEPALRAMLEE